MRIFLTFCLTCACSITFAQFAIINAHEGSAKVWHTGGTGNASTDLLQNGHLVYCDNFTVNEDSAVVSVRYIKNNKEFMSRVVRKDQVTYLSAYNSIPAGEEKKAAVTLKRDSIEILLSTRPVSKAKRWKTEAGYARYEYKLVQARIGRRKIVLPPKALERLHDPTLSNSKAYYNRQNDVLYIMSHNSDGAASYNVIWVIEKGVYKTRYVGFYAAWQD